MHSKTPITAIKETPAHVGWRNEVKTITNLNTETGQTGTHELNSRVPIYGNIQEAKTVYRNDVRSYDLNQKTFGPIRTTVTEN